MQHQPYPSILEGTSIFTYLTFTYSHTKFNQWQYFYWISIHWKVWINNYYTYYVFQLIFFLKVYYFHILLSKPRRKSPIFSIASCFSSSLKLMSSKVPLMGSFGTFLEQLQKIFFFSAWKNVENQAFVNTLNLKEIASAVPMLNNYSFCKTIALNRLIFASTF